MRRLFKISGDLRRGLRKLASLIDVPPEDVASGRTYPTFRAEQADLKQVRIRARVGSFPPVLEDAYVSAHYRGRWFWIDNSDFRSKQVFSCSSSPRPPTPRACR